MLAPAGQSKSYRKGSEGRRRSRPRGPGASGFSSLVRAQLRCAPDTPTAPHRPAPALRSRGCPRGSKGRAGVVRAERRGARRGRLCSPGGQRPGAAGGRLASPRPAWFPEPGSPSPPHGRPPLPPRARPVRAPAAPRFRVRLRGRPVARARAESSGSEFAFGRAGTRAHSVSPPSPTSGLLLSSRVAPAAPWRPPQEGPAPNPPLRLRGTR